ncbi:MAG TPA: hypothetical protein VE504_00290, partial [Nitrososphaeraceae archaeon]|nr:hypothetical protein [Nitrososphaeraceae archaeon]
SKTAATTSVVGRGIGDPLVHIEVIFCCEYTDCNGPKELRKNAKITKIAIVTKIENLFLGNSILPTSRGIKYKGFGDPLR